MGPGVTEIPTPSYTRCTANEDATSIVAGPGTEVAAERGSVTRPDDSRAAEPRSATPSTQTMTRAQTSSSSPSHPSLQQESWLRSWRPSTTRSSIGSAGPVEIPERYAPLGRFARTWRTAQFPIPDTLQPSMASAYITCGVVSCPDRPDELPSMEWSKTMRISGLGKVEINAYSAYVRLSMKRQRYIAVH